MNLLLINPNTTASMTRSMAEAARRVARPDTRITAVQPSFGPVSIEGHHDEVIAAAGVLEQVRQAGTGADAVVLACFGDPGLDAAREATEAPVLGIAEAAFHAASFVSTGFSVVTTLVRTCVIAEHLVLKYGYERRCRGVHGTDIPVLALEEDDGLACVPALEDACRAALARDRSGAIVLGCGGMASVSAELQRRLGVPVIDGVAAAVVLAEALVQLGLRTSKQGDYATPLPKRYLGWAGALGW
ncbi:aspartate/glutamate racemase family protein [Ideonella sp. 4Y16]|uniref:aspartate/glutamate racemase family protein n=1 Tax=Ideonella alba TaxID=2824118 RepID=UPI001B37BE43|nr:aspartate/glutamate racemase family protein [Ideonella alba]MBQ0944086.1 aspartate/glutamate racemase family protein [Ideonella alba]